MAKKIILCTILLLIAVSCLVACGTDKPNTPPKSEDGWKAISQPKESDVYAKLLGAIFDIAGDFTKTSISAYPRLSVDGGVKLSANGSDLWLSFKANYYDHAPQDTMISIILSKTEGSYDDMLAGIFLHNEILYVAIGVTRFTIEMPASNWKEYFPIYLSSTETSSTISKVSLLLASTIVLKDDVTGKSRLKGSIEEFAYSMNIDLPKTITKLYENLKTATEEIIPLELLEEYERLIANLLGMSISEIKSDFPKSNVKLDFTVSNKKLSALDFDLYVEKPASDTLFEGENIALKAQLNYLNIKKGGAKSPELVNVPIEFVTNTAQREEYTNYLESVFKFIAEAELTQDSKKKTYIISMAARVFQTETFENFLFIEFIDKSTGKVEQGAYIYKDVAYIVNNNQCVLAFDFNLTEQAWGIFNQGFAEANSANVMGLATYIIGAIRVKSDKLIFNNLGGFLSEVWVNYDLFVEELDNGFDEKVSEQQAYIDFMSYLLEKPFNLIFPSEKMFLFLLSDEDENIATIIATIESYQPEKEIMYDTDAEEDTDIEDEQE